MLKISLIILSLFHFSAFSQTKKKKPEKTPAEKAFFECRTTLYKLDAFCGQAATFCDITLSCRQLEEKCSGHIQARNANKKAREEDKKTSKKEQDNCDDLNKCIGQSCIYDSVRRDYCENSSNTEYFSLLSMEEKKALEINPHRLQNCPGFSFQALDVYYTYEINNPDLTCSGHEEHYYHSLDTCSDLVTRFNSTCLNEMVQNEAKIQKRNPFVAQTSHAVCEAMETSYLAYKAAKIEAAKGKEIADGARTTEDSKASETENSENGPKNSQK